MTIALCFLTLGDLSQTGVWNAYLAAASGVNVYCHPKSSLPLASTLLRQSVISERVQTAHGHVSLVDASLNLFRAAYKESGNQHFILLSDTTVPIAPFATVADGLARHAGQSQISFRIPGEGTEHFCRQYSLPSECQFTPFFEHDQWVILCRRHVEKLLEKPLIHCFERMFAPDEHYFLNVLIHHAGISMDEIINHRRTFVNWRQREVREVRSETGLLLERTIRPRTYHHLTALDVAEARREECWFFRKVSSQADCGHLLDVVS